MKSIFTWNELLGDEDRKFEPANKYKIISYPLRQAAKLSYHKSR
jgi:hypothetical protein